MMMRNDCISIIGKEKWNKLSVQEKANILDKSLHNQSIKIENPFIFSIKNAKIDNIIESFIDKPENNIIIDNDNNENTETLLIEYKPKEEVIESVEIIPDKIDIEIKQEDIVPVTIEYTPMEVINKEIETHTETEIKDATSEVIEEVINNTETEKEVVETDLNGVDIIENKEIKIIEQPVVEPNIWIPMDIKTIEDDSIINKEQETTIDDLKIESNIIYYTSIKYTQLDLGLYKKEKNKIIEKQETKLNILDNKLDNPFAFTFE